MATDLHPFFTEINDHPDLAKICRLDIVKLPDSNKGKNKVKAILIGADPTNSGVRGEPDLIQLETVFGIGPKYEKYFFSPQLRNLQAINLGIEDLFVQNLCRNYFLSETSKNKEWNKVAELWIKHLKHEIDEIENIDKRVPIFVTAEKIMKVFFPKVPKASILYSMKGNLPIYSERMGRNVYPLYRHYSYFLTLDNWKEYKDYLVVNLNQE